ncbi:hypothetical protein J40TS1_35020 [Paenibacillus montaniterrae]|uniref:Uncharacterized protein n=1 Tax=Paenibacillus montaniterrae TaxID=429341 RepID=A0A919YR23_9BACL|nr:hypothetical protein [Paenibacillus montaniterrae]GIP17860.1 hypothetical protein J40TS1_35020 [Paenibacillus montaniterrae]
MTVIILIGLILYHIPSKYERNYQVSTIDGEIANFKIDITYYRLLLVPNRVEGKITLNEITYRSFQPDSNRNFIQRLYKKINGELEYPWFIADGAVGSEELKRIVIILDESNIFEQSYFMQYDERISPTSKVFYGPAINANEAIILSKKFMDS